MIFLFVLPMITMRTYAEEKRSGTIELLLTSPLTDLQIILGKFLGAMGALRRDAGASRCIHIGVLFCVRQPRVAADRSPTYLGLLLMGGCFISLGLLISSLTQEPDRRRHGHLRACS